MLDFKAVLEKVVRAVPGSLVAMVIGRDGVIVESCQNMNIGLEPDVIGAEYSGVVAEVHKQLSVLKMDELKDVTIVLDRFKLVAHVISDDYYFMTFLSVNANEALARYKTRIFSLKLHELM
jgi:predicted regulator of Ras-like GTPase activity (Roadblock/LC7/MglB family)